MWCVPVGPVHILEWITDLSEAPTHRYLAVWLLEKIVWSDCLPSGLANISSATFLWDCWELYFACQQLLVPALIYQHLYFALCWWLFSELKFTHFKTWSLFEQKNNIHTTKILWNTFIALLGRLDKIMEGNKHLFLAHNKICISICSLTEGVTSQAVLFLSILNTNMFCDNMSGWVTENYHLGQG
jgi:hypothetical protein